MDLLSNRKDRRWIATMAAPAFVLALAACGGGDTVSSTDAALAPAPVEQTTDAPDSTSSAPETTEPESADSSTETSEAASETSEVVDTPAEPADVQIPLLSPDEAIANAEVNQPTLQLAENVLDIETLAVGDGSVQTLRDVVDGDRPVLLWFFSPH